MIFLKKSQQTKKSKITKFESRGFIPPIEEVCIKATSEGVST